MIAIRVNHSYTKKNIFNIMALLLFIPKNKTKKMTAKDWYNVAKRECWTNEQLGKQIIEAAKQLND